MKIGFCSFCFAYALVMVYVFIPKPITLHWLDAFMFLLCLSSLFFIYKATDVFEIVLGWAVVFMPSFFLDYFGVSSSKEMAFICSIIVVPMFFCKTIWIGVVGRPKDQK